MSLLSRLLNRLAPPPEGQRSFEGAAGGRRWAGAGEMRAANAAALAARGPLKSRARYQAENHPLAASAVGVWTAGLVGTGFRPQPQDADPAVRAELGRRWYAWADTAGGDDGSLLAVLELAARGIIRDGEALARLELVPQGDALGLVVRLLDPEQLDPTVTRDLGHGARIVAGVEFGPEGSRLAYHVRPEPIDLPFASVAPPVRIPADEVLHAFARHWPGQVRGVSALAPVLAKLNELDATSDALQMRLKTEALFTGFVRDLEGGAGGLASGAGPVAGLELEPGSLVNLPPGTDITFSSPSAGSANVVDFLRAQQREVAAGVGLLYEQLTGDLSATNYSSARFGLLEHRRRLRLLQRTVLVDQLLAPLWRRFVELAEHNLWVPPGTAAGPAPRWVLPGFEATDPEKEVRADALAVENRFKSRVEVIESRGLDIDELDAEIAADRFRPPAAASAATAARPAEETAP